MKKLVKKTTGFLILSLACLGARFSMADDIVKQIDEAQSQYKAQEYSEAIAELLEAVSAIKKLQQNDLVQALPQSFSGWDKSEVKIESTQGFAAGLSGGRVYVTFQKEKSSILLEVSIDSPLSAMLQGAMNPAIVAMSPDLSTVRINGEKAVANTQNEKNPVLFLVLAANNVAINIEGKNTDVKTVEALAQLVNMDLLKNVK